MPHEPIRGAQARGRFGESEAARWYIRNGYEVVARNWRCAMGEIDLVVSAPGLVVFCEVKARAGDEFGGPQGAVDRRKQLRVRRAAAMWLSEHRPGAVTVRFDVAAVVGARVEMIESAF
ncbi:MAG TPA: YraN family protein [Ilumatobacteraceae bacterium]|nr:YraN family protein [Ilumatobacteraceae bacterium]